MFRFSIRFFRLLRFSRLFRPLMKFKMEVGLFKVWKCELDIIWDCGTTAEQESERERGKFRFSFPEDLGNNAINSSLQNARIQEHPKSIHGKPQLTFHRRSFFATQRRIVTPGALVNETANETVNATGLRTDDGIFACPVDSTFNLSLEKIVFFHLSVSCVFPFFPTSRIDFICQLDCRSQMLLAQSEETYDHHCEEILQFLDTYVVKIPLHHQKMYPLQHWKLLE